MWQFLFMTTWTIEERFHTHDHFGHVGSHPRWHRHQSRDKWVYTAELHAEAAAWVKTSPSAGGAEGAEQTNLFWPSGTWRGWYEQATRKHLLPDFPLEFSTPRVRGQLRGHGVDDVGAYVLEGGCCSSIVIVVDEERGADLAPRRQPPRVAFVKRYLVHDPSARLDLDNLNLGHSLVYQGEVVAGWLEIDLGVTLTSTCSGAGGGATSDGQSSIATSPRRRKLLVPNLTQVRLSLQKVSSTGTVLMVHARCK